MGLGTPQPLRAEHDELHRNLSQAIAKGGRTGDAARIVAQRLHPHFLREEAFAMPPLALLRVLSRDEEVVSADDESKVLELTEQLRAELPAMLEEHGHIVAALDDLTAAARAERHEDVAAFAEKLVLHAQTEEEVLYPAALLVGRYLKLRQTMSR